VTLQVIAESLSKIGVPVFMADVKGDLSGLAKAGAPNPKISERLATLGLDEPQWAGCPTTFWDVLASRAIRCGPRCPTSGRCSCRACST